MKIVKNIITLLIFILIGLFLGGLIEFARQNELGIHLLVMALFFLFTAVNRKNIKDAQRIHIAHVKLPIWERIIFFPLLKNLFKNENIRFQRILVLNTFVVLIIITIQTGIWPVLTLVIHILKNNALAKKWFL